MSDNLIRNCMRKITMASNASLICCEYDGDGVMCEAQGEHFDIIGLMAAAIIMYSQKCGREIVDIQNEVDNIIDIIMEQENYDV